MYRIEGQKIGMSRMAISLNPVTDVTRFLNLARRQITSSKEALSHYTRLVEWISDTTHPTDYEAISLVRFLGATLAKKNLITTEQFQSISQRVVTTEANECPTDEINSLMLQLKKSGGLTKEIALGFFDRMIQWIASSDKDEEDDENGDYGCSVTSIFSLVLDCHERQIISDEEKRILFNRAYRVLMKTPGRKIKDPDLHSHIKHHVKQHL